MKMFLIALEDYDGVQPKGVYSTRELAELVLRDYFPSHQITELEVDKIPDRKAFKVHHRRLQEGGVPCDRTTEYWVEADDNIPVELVLENEGTIIVHVCAATRDEAVARADELMAEFKRTRVPMEKLYNPL